MLSIENPPDPSCSSKLLAVKANERASEKIAFQEADTVALEDTPTPNFCIRDYVFASRSKDIEASWPFTQQSLQLCLKHGIKDILPPFESHGLVRGHCLSKLAETEQPVSCSAAKETIPNSDSLEPGDTSPSNEQPVSFAQKPCLPLEELVLECSDPGIRSSPEDWKSTVEQGTSLDEAVRPSPSELEDTEPSYTAEKLTQPLEKKCKLIVKLGAISNLSRTDDVVSNSSTVSDPMASKVCPVCKTFSSTSNTTLNAHIDQCLSMESNTKKVLSKFPKVKVKPRKKRLMVDIYTTAPHCTLEDLDRRNGTNWAVELALLVTPNSEVATDSKRPKLSPNESSNDAKDEAVYVDSNGIKLRILSKFSDMPLPTDELKLRKQAKEFNPNKHTLIRKRKDFAPKYLKNLKVKAQNRKLCSFKLLKWTQIQATRQGDDEVENYQKNDESPLHVSDAENQVRKDNSSTPRQRVCSRRSDVLQNFTTEDTFSIMKNKLPAIADSQAENILPDPSNSFPERRHPNKFSRSSEGFAGSMKRKRVNFLCSSVHTTADGKRKSTESHIPSSRWSANSSLGNGLLLRLSRSSRKLISSSKSKLEGDKGFNRMLDNTCNLAGRPAESCPSSIIDQTDLALNMNESIQPSHLPLEQTEVEGRDRPCSPKKFRKHRSNLRGARRGAEVQASFGGGVPGPAEDTDLDVVVKNMALGSCHSALLKGVKRGGAGEYINQMSLTRSDAQESDKRVHSNATGEQEHDGLNQLPHGRTSQEAITESLDMPAEISDYRDYATGPSIERAVRNHIANVGKSGTDEENLQAASDTQLDPHSCTDEWECHGPRSEAHQEQLKQKSTDQDILHVDVSCNKIRSEDIPMVDEIEVRGADDSCLNQLAECHADTTSLQESDGCLTNQGYSRFDKPQKTSSFTSVTAANHNKSLTSDRELSGSPSSIASTLSLTSPKDTKFIDSNAELLGNPIAQQYNLEAAAPRKDNNGAAEGRSFEQRNQDVKGKLASKEPGQTLGDNPFCCSCRESLSRESQLLRQNANARSAKEMQGSSLFIGPRVSSSFSAYQNGRAKTYVEPPSYMSSTKYSHDAAAKYPPNTSDLDSPSSSSQYQNTSTSNPVLRLMGKNLMVVNNEEFVRPQSNASEYSYNVNILPPGIASTNHLLQLESLPYPHHKILGESLASPAQAISIGNHQMPLQLPLQPGGAFARSPYRSDWANLPDQHTQQKRPYRRLNSSNASYMTNEVIVIDDSPEHETELKSCLVSPTSTLPLTASNLSHLPQLPFSRFPSPSQFHEASGRHSPLLQNFYPGVSASLLHQESITEGHQGSFLPNPLIFQSPLTGQMRPSMYYSLR